MEFIEQYAGELFLAMIGTFITTAIASFKAFMARIRKIEEHMAEIDKKLEINTALDKQRDKIISKDG